LSTKSITIFSFFLLLQLNNFSHAQSSFQWGALPTLNFNKKLKKDWSLNSKIESRMLFQRGEIGGEPDKNYTYVLTDFSLIAAKKVGLNSRIGGGYLIRVQKDNIYHRFIQQFVIIQKLTKFRLAHRFLSDQTFSAIEDPEFRLRYRITSEVPLNGESVDSGEFYLKINNEYVNSLQSGSYDLEIRVIPFLGYEVNDAIKIETGLDYRVNSFFTNNTRHSYWMSLNFFFEL